MSAPARRGSLLLNWRVWLSFGVTALALYWTLRDVDLRAVGQAMASADLRILAVAAAVTVFGVFVRALRWRHLTLQLAAEPLPMGALFRATAVGFMAINVFPLRIGELIRPWFLAQETGVRGSAALGTLILERAIDFTCVVALGALVLLAHGEQVPLWVRRAGMLLAVLSCFPYLLAIALRVDERRTIGLLSVFARTLPLRYRERALDLVTQVCRGLASLRGWRTILRVVAYSIALWGIVFSAPWALGFLAFGFDLPLREGLLAAYTVTVFTALASAAPAAPGFFGVWHFACREALALFGIAHADGVAYGTALHLTYWLPVTALGMLAAFASGTPLGRLASPPLGKAASEPHR